MTPPKPAYPDKRPVATGRDRALEALRQAGETGLLDADLHAAATLAGSHIPSLIAEGFGIETTWIEPQEGKRGGYGWRLTRDPWA